MTVQVRDCLSTQALDTIVEAKKTRATRKRPQNAVTPGKSIKVGDLKKLSLFDDKRWQCNACNINLRKKEIWIACDKCDRVFHLICTHMEIEGKVEDFDVDNTPFHCHLC